MTSIELFEVGGCVRDELMGRRTKDIDFTVVAPSFEDMREHLLSEGFTIHTENPEFFTIRCGVPEGHPLRGRTKDADFVWARKDGPYSDGRRPDWVEPGTLLDDLARRDFTINAMARDASGLLIDPFYGKHDIDQRVLRFVGDPMDRIREDGLRVARGLRFAVTHELHIQQRTWEAMNSIEGFMSLMSVSRERVREEMERMMASDTLTALALLRRAEPRMTDALFRDGLRLSATTAD